MYIDKPTEKAYDNIVVNQTRNYLIMAVVQQNPSNHKGVQKIITFAMDCQGNKKGEHDKLDEYLLEGYRVIDIITNVLPKGGAATSPGYLSVIIFLSKSNDAGIYKAQ